MSSRRLSVTATLLLAAIGSASAGPGSRIGATGAGPAMGEMHMRAGRPQLAISAFESVLAGDPDNVPARLGLGLAQAKLGQCEVAAQTLDPVRTQRWFRIEAYLGEGTCALSNGDITGAIERLEEAVVFNIKQARPAYELTLARHLAGDVEGAQAALDDLEGRRDNEVMLQLARLRLALGTDDYVFERVEAEKAFRREGHPTDKFLPLLFLEARAHLLDGAPELAKDALLLPAKSELKNQTYALWRAEACRRMADLECAGFASTRPAIANARPIPLAYAIRSRILVDSGEIDAARAELESHPNPRDPEYVASVWYLERAVGGDAERLARIYDVLRRTDSGDLSLLIPRSAP